MLVDTSAVTNVVGVSNADNTSQAHLNQVASALQNFPQLELASHERMTGLFSQSSGAELNTLHGLPDKQQSLQSEEHSLGQLPKPNYLTSLLDSSNKNPGRGGPGM